MKLLSIAYELLPRTSGQDPAVDATNIIREWWNAKTDKGRLEWNEQNIGDSACEFSLQEITRENLELRTNIRVCSSMDATAACLAIEMEAHNGVPPFGKPRFLSELANRIDLRRAGSSFTTTAEQATTYDEGRQIAERVVDPARNAPMVVISLDKSLSVPGEDWPQRMADRLSGMANVVCLAKEATFGLTGGDGVGDKFSCFDGGVRLYFPVGDVDPEPIGHPLFLRTKLVRWSDPDLDKGFLRLLFALTQLLARYYAEHPRMPEPLRRARWVERKYQALLQVASSGKEELQYKNEQLEVQVGELRRYLEEFERENSKLEGESARLRDRCDQLEKDNSVLEQRLAGQTPEAESNSDEDAPPKTFEEAIERAKSQFSDTLYLADLEDPENFNPDEVFTILRCMHDTCGRQRSGGLKGSAGQLLAQELHKEGIGGRYETGDTSLNGTLANGSKIECRHRIHVKSGAPAKTQSIYWAEDKTGSKMRYLVRRIGRHA